MLRRGKHTRGAVRTWRNNKGSYNQRFLIYNVDVNQIFAVHEGGTGRTPMMTKSSTAQPSRQNGLNLPDPAHSRASRVQVTQASLAADEAENPNVAKGAESCRGRFSQKGRRLAKSTLFQRKREMLAGQTHGYVRGQQDLLSPTFRPLSDNPPHDAKV